MPSCLGLYIEENLIKYAKVLKEQNSYKVEAFGVKFFENFNEAINQIVEETNSYNIPISTNIFSEIYTSFNMPTILSKNDLQKAIKTEFEFDCSDKGINPQAFETKYAIMENVVEKDKYKILHVSANKIDVQKRLNELKEVDLRYAIAMPFVIPNLVDVDKKENYMIVNIEKDTVITTVLQNKVYEIETLENGSEEILAKINEYENSYAKSYEIVKNTTIYTSLGDTAEEEQMHLNSIVGTLYNIVAKIMKMINTSVEPIQKVYITGTGALVNNIELYFQEYLVSVKCEVLKPYFSDGTMNNNIKDYIEVNSAVALGMSALGEGIQGINFAKTSVMAGMFKKGSGSKKTKDKKEKGNSSVKSSFTSIAGLKWDLGEGFDRLEKSLVRTAVGILIFTVFFSIGSIIIGNEINKKYGETEEYIADVNNQIQKANADEQTIVAKEAEYESLIKSIQEANEKIDDKNSSRNSIPNLLNQIMAVVPQNVQVTSIENLSGTKVIIEAQSDKYEQLGFFIAEIKTGVILKNVVSTSGYKSDSVVTIRIEGELP